MNFIVTCQVYLTAFSIAFQCGGRFNLIFSFRVALFSTKEHTASSFCTVFEQIISKFNELHCAEFTVRPVR